MSFYPSKIYFLNLWTLILSNSRSKLLHDLEQSSSHMEAMPNTLLLYPTQTHSYT
jgi:hypothetical protein